MNTMIVKAGLATEKSIRLMESENKLVFIVDKKATKADVKESLESLYKVQVKNVNTMVGPDGKKRAYVTFSDETPAIDIATKLELM